MNKTLQKLCLKRIGYSKRHTKTGKVRNVHCKFDFPQETTKTNSVYCFDCVCSNHTQHYCQIVSDCYFQTQQRYIVCLPLTCIKTFVKLPSILSLYENSHYRPLFDCLLAQMKTSSYLTHYLKKLSSVYFLKENLGFTVA